MKSAYELAMERLEKTSGPTKKLTHAQKAKIADIEKTYDAKIAEARLAYESRLRSVASAEELEACQTELAGKLTDLEGRRNREKEAVWNTE